MMKESSKRRVVITGYGMITPLGKDTGETFDHASRGMSGIDYIRTFDTQNLPCRIGGQVDDAWLEGEDDRAARFYKFSSRGLRLIARAAGEAVKQARLNELARRDRIGVSLGFHGESPAGCRIKLFLTDYVSNCQRGIPSSPSDSIPCKFRFISHAGCAALIR